jgi:hypothetical protein
MQLFISRKARRRRRALAELTLEELKRGERVDVRIEPLCIFLFRDGTDFIASPHSFFYKIS